MIRTAIESDFYQSTMRHNAYFEEGRLQYARTCHIKFQDKLRELDWNPFPAECAEVWC